MRKIFTTSLILFPLLLAVCIPASAEDFSGKVVGVIEGDTIEVMHLGKPERVKLLGVDCPEMNQPYGKKARQYTTTHTLRKTVSVIVHDTDNYGHTIGQVVLPDMSNLSIVLVSAGLAWWKERHVPEDELLKDIQESAWRAKRGLWADPAPVPPWEWRRGAREPSSYQQEQPGSGSPGSGDLVVYTNRTGNKYHRDGCRSLRWSRIPIKLSEARDWYSPCSLCDPPR